MNWLDQLRTRFRGRNAILNDPNQQIGACKVNLSGFPADRLIIDVDRLISNDVFASEVIASNEQRCDLIVFYDRSGTPSITLLEAKGTRYEAFGDEFKAVDQLRSSQTVLRRALDRCTIDLPEFAIHGAVVTGSMNSGALMGNDLRTATLTAEVDITVVSSGWDVYREMFGR